MVLPSIDKNVGVMRSWDHLLRMTVEHVYKIHLVIIIYFGLLFYLCK